MNGSLLAFVPSLEELYCSPVLTLTYGFQWNNLYSFISPNYSDRLT